MDSILSFDHERYGTALHSMGAKLAAAYDATVKANALCDISHTLEGDVQEQISDLFKDLGYGRDEYPAKK